MQKRFSHFNMTIDRLRCFIGQRSEFRHSNEIFLPGKIKKYRCICAGLCELLHHDCGHVHTLNAAICWWQDEHDENIIERPTVIKQFSSQFKTFLLMDYLQTGKRWRKTISSTCASSSRWLGLSFLRQEPRQYDKRVTAKLNEYVSKTFLHTSLLEM